MKKTKNGNSIAFLAGVIITFLAITVALLILYIQNRDIIAYNNMSTYDEIMYNDLRVKYPNNYDDVMKNYSFITSYLYSNEIKEEEIPDVVEQQRYLFSDEIIMRNSYKAQIEGVKREREELKLAKDYILSLDFQEIIIDEEYPNYADVDVIQYMKSGTNLYGTYTLKKYGEQWKIATWEMKGVVDENEW